ncbi:hypothetical protein MD484_g7409, partial [Candolleomyces efflorescens]
MQLDAYETRLLLCEPKWSASPTASKTRYQHHVQQAQQRAEDMFGAQSTPVWLPVVIHRPSTSQLTADQHTEDAERLVHPDSADLPDAEALILQDILQEEGTQENETVDPESGPTICWETPTALIIDPELTESIAKLVTEPCVLGHHKRRVTTLSDTYERTFEFCTPSIERLNQPKARLNDVCINSGALLIQYGLSREQSPTRELAKSCAIFSTFHIHLARYNRNSASVWSRSKANPRNIGPWQSYTPSIVV